MTFQAKLTTKLDRFTINDTIIELSNDVDKDQLNHIVKNVLKQSDTDIAAELDQATFDFIVGGRFLHLTVEKHLELYSDEIDAKEILSEKLIEIEYVLSLDPPKPLETIPHEDWVSCVDTNESYMISGSYDRSIRIFCINDRKKLAEIQNAHEASIIRVRWIHPTKVNKKRDELFFVSCGHDEISIMRKFNTRTMIINTVAIFKGHNRSVNCIDSYDDLLATGSFDKTLRIWSISNSTDMNDISVDNETQALDSIRKKQRTKSSSTTIEKSAISTLTGHQESITGVRWLDNIDGYNSVATCSLDRTICIWDVEVGECKRRMLCSKPLLSLDHSSEHNLILTSSCDRHVRVWDSRGPDNATAKTAYTSHNAWVSRVSFGKGTNNFITGGYDNLVKIWDLRSTKVCLYDMIGHHDKVLDVNWNNPKYVVSGSADATSKIFAM